MGIGRAALVVLLLWGGALAAQTTSELGDTQLRAEGWEFEEGGANPGNVAAGTLALTAGALWHGVGHRYARDPRTARLLAVGEAVALGIVGTGVATSAAAPASRAARTLGGSLGAAGGSLFVATWIADVIGSYKGSAATLPDSTQQMRGLGAEVYVTALADNGVGVTSVAAASLPMVAGPVVLRPSAEVSLDLDYRLFSAYGGYRVELGRRSSYIELGGLGLDEAIDEHGAGRTRLAGALTLALDLGDLAKHLGGLMWSNRIEPAWEYAWFDFDGRRRFRRSMRTFHLPFELGFDFNVDQSVNLGLGYAHRRDLLVGAIGRRAGAAHVRLGVVPRGRLGIELRLEQGAFTRAWFGLRWQPARSS